MRYGVNPIVLLSNNGSYTIESEIHDGWGLPGGDLIGCRLLRQPCNARAPKRSKLLPTAMNHSAASRSPAGTHTQACL